MRKFFWISVFLICFIALLLFAVSSINAAGDGLTLSSPSSCPVEGCAAGQRLNFRVEFSADPVYTTGTNTQICIYAPKFGQSSGSNPWGDFSQGWISDSGILTGQPYTQGETGSICSTNTDTNDAFMTGAFTSLPSTASDQLTFALHIHPEAEIDGDVRVKVFQADSTGSNWSLSDTFNLTIPVTAYISPAYVAQTPNNCGSFAPCYVNSGDDLAGGLGTGLRDAVLSSNPGDEIRILDNYVIKNNTVLIDKDITVLGQESATLSALGSSCTEPMLSFVNGGLLQNLSINDGNCSTPTSRTLVEIDSPINVSIEHNSLNSGQRAVEILDNDGDVTVAFNHITNNEYAVFRQSGTVNSGWVNIFANNIYDNRSSIQVVCNSLGNADHNFWGEGIFSNSSISNCTLTKGKELGAAIKLSTEGAGVSAQRKRVTSDLSYSFDNQIGVSHKAADPDFDVIIVNHSQGSALNIPFYEEGSGLIDACSNFYDVFLAVDAQASDLQLVIKYDQAGDDCVTRIESAEYCNQSDSSKYPLWWYDPAESVTDGWDRTGQSPTGPGAGGAVGQTTTCNMSENEIRVQIDASGRPGISNDLNFTPFVVGLPVVDGVTLTQFTSTFDVTKIKLKWITESETNIRGFYVVRSEKEAGPYTRISPEIEAIGDSFIGGIYNYTDEDVSFNKTYYYKIQVADKENNIIQTLGPASALTSTPTPTVTLTRTNYPTSTAYPTSTFYPTRTPYPTRQYTPYTYRSPTPRYRTATPVTFGTPDAYPINSTPRSTQISLNPTRDLTRTLDSNAGYPMDEFSTQQPDGYPVNEDPLKTPPSDLFDPDAEGGADPQGEREDLGEPSNSGSEGDEEKMPKNLSWLYLVIGAASAISLFGGLSVFLAKSYFL